MSTTITFELPAGWHLINLDDRVDRDVVATVDRLKAKPDQRTALIGLLRVTVKLAQDAAGLVLALLLEPHADNPLTASIMLSALTEPQQKAATAVTPGAPSGPAFDPDADMSIVTLPAGQAIRICKLESVAGNESYVHQYIVTSYGVTLTGTISETDLAEEFAELVDLVALTLDNGSDT
jgi:hypothetical protein